MDVDLTKVFAAAGVPMEMLDRIDQSWSLAVAGGPRELGQYVKAAETVVGAVVTGLTIKELGSLGSPARRGSISDTIVMSPYDSQPLRIRDVVGDVMARVVMAPLTEPAVRPGRVIALHAVENVGLRFRLGIGQVWGLPDDVPPADIDLMATYFRRPNSGQAVSRADEMLQEIARILSVPGWSAERIRSVLQPDNEEVLATWLGTSRPTLRVWEERGLAPGDKGKRARTVEQIAELIDRHIDLGDVSRYVHDTVIEALGDVTLGEALSTAPTEQLCEYADDLRDILVW